jgi:hypothetical protein
MAIALPSMPENLAYALVAATAVTIFAGFVVAGSGDLAGAVLVFALAAAIYWFIGRTSATLVTAKEAGAAVTVLLALCALADLATGSPYQAVLFLLAAAALGFALLLMQQGTVASELRLGGLVAVAAPSGRIHLRMLAELRDAGILSADEFAAKSALIEA